MIPDCLWEETYFPIHHRLLFGMIIRGKQIKEHLMLPRMSSKPNKGKKVDENYVESINNTVTNKIRFSDRILKQTIIEWCLEDYQ